MKEKGGHFIPSVALALAAHALLFLVFTRLLTTGTPAVTRARIELVEVQLSGTGGQGGDGGSSVPRSAARRSAASASRTPPRPAAAPAPRTLTLPQPTPPQLAVPQPSPPPAQGAVEPGGQAAPTEAGAGASTGTSGAAPAGDGLGNAGPGGSGNGGAGESMSGPAGEPPPTISDIDPVPLQSISAPYPASARKLGQQGLVKVRADIDDRGIVIEEAIRASSGFASLDNAALDAVKRTRFLPAVKNGKPVASSVVISVRFHLSED
ncbi:MAG: TonB family protein [Spirochaetia bacterium]